EIGVRRWRRLTGLRRRGLGPRWCRWLHLRRRDLRWRLRAHGRAGGARRALRGNRRFDLGPVLFDRWSRRRRRRRHDSRAQDGEPELDLVTVAQHGPARRHGTSLDLHAVAALQVENAKALVRRLDLGVTARHRALLVLQNEL